MSTATACGEEAQGMTSSSTKKHVPAWVGERLGMSVTEVATLCIPNDGFASVMNGPYHRYLKYLAKVAWDVAETPELDLKAAQQAAAKRAEEKAAKQRKREADKEDKDESETTATKDGLKANEKDNCESPKDVENGNTTTDIPNGIKTGSEEEKEGNRKPNESSARHTKEKVVENEADDSTSRFTNSTASPNGTGSTSEATGSDSKEYNSDDEYQKDVNPGLSNIIVNRFKQKSFESRSGYSSFFGSLHEMSFSMSERNVRAEYGMGLGRAVLSVNGEDVVYVVHRETGSSTLALKTCLLTPRMVHLYARSTSVLRAVTEDMIEVTAPRPPRKPKQGKYMLYSMEVDCNNNARWAKQGLKQARSLASVVLPEGMMDSIVDDFKDFTSKETKAWYVSHGLPYRRSYLFYGPPGVGKTSCVRALAGTFQIPACFISLGNMKIGNNQLHEAMKTVPKPSILVFEDIDSLFNEKRQAENALQLTFSGLLNALDGLVAAEGVVSVMTTNHIERLDPALVRAGRVDRRFEFTSPHHEQIAQLFASYYPSAARELAIEFANTVFGRGEREARSIATLQQHFIYTRKKSARQCIDLLEDFFTQFYPKASASSMSYFT